MTLFRVAVAILLGAIFLWISAMNWYVRYRRARGRNHPSWIPLMAGVAGSIALLVAPTASLNRLWWLPALLDYGTVPGILETIWFHWRRTRGT